MDESSSQNSTSRVTIGMPAYGHVPALCVLSLGSFIAHGVASGLVTNLSTSIGAYIDRARNDIVRQALDNDCTHLMFVDQDMILPELALRRLLGHDKPVAGGLYFGKDDFFTPVAFDLKPFKRVYDLGDLEASETESDLPEGLECTCGKPDNHIHWVDGVGMGCTLIQMQVFRDMEDKYGDQMWFSSKETGEDVHFATRCQEMGVPIFLDGFVICGHVRDQLVSKEHFLWAKEHRDGNCDGQHDGDDSD